MPGEAKTAPEPPASLALPVAVRLRNLTIGELRFGERGRDLRVLHDIRLQGEADQASIRVARAGARYGATEVDLTGTLGATRPFPVSAHAELRSIVLDRAVQATVDANGSLLDMKLSGKSGNETGRIDADVHLAPFAPVPLVALSLAAADFRPEKWVPGIPAMQLTGTATLKPGPGTSFTIAGPFNVVNAIAGPIDRQRLPVQSARGALQWSAAALELVIERVDAAGGTARGGVTRGADGAFTAQATFAGIDGARIHTAIAATQASGQIDYRLDQGQQRFTGRASNARGLALDIDFAVVLANEALDIQRAIARLGDGRAEISGRVQLGRQTSAQLRGEFHAIDLSRLIPGVDTRLNGRLNVDGTLQPIRRGRAQLTLTDSRLYGRPLDGHADLRLDGELFDIDTALTSGAARLNARGGLGAGRELSFDLSAPRLADLVPNIAGAVTAQGTISGTLQAPAIVAQGAASGLVLPNQQRIDNITVDVRGGAQPEAPLDLAVNLAGHRMPGRPEMSLASATLTARGTTSAHTLELAATTASNEPLNARGTGGWQQNAWRGQVDSIVAGKPFDLRLEAATPVVLASDRIAVGPAAFVARGTRFAEVELARADGRWRGAGSFENLQPQAFDPRARAPRRAVRTTAGTPQPLTLAGRWSMEYTDALNGIFVIERTSGDLYSGVDAVTRSA
jgi:translocation and assembly module TamB